jgi:hypothetical protein
MFLKWCLVQLTLCRLEQSDGTILPIAVLYPSFVEDYRLRPLVISMKVVCVWSIGGIVLIG